jgi:hypothetical protein
MNLFKTIKLYHLILILFLSALVFGCSSNSIPATPLDTLKAYTKAIKKEDLTTMKLLLSGATIKMHEQQAKEQGVTLDDIMKRETLFNPSQTSLKYKNEKIEGDKATVEVENSFGTYETVPFVKEEGIWKIDKQGYADQLRQQTEQQNNQAIDDIINQGRVEP